VTTGLSRTVFELNGVFGRKSQIFPPRVSLVFCNGGETKIDDDPKCDMFIRLDTIPRRDGQAGRRRDRNGKKKHFTRDKNRSIFGKVMNYE